MKSSQNVEEHEMLKSNIRKDDLFAPVSFGGGGGSSGGRNDTSRTRNFHNNRPRGSYTDALDYNNNGKIGDELTLAAGVAGGLVLAAAPEPGTTIAGGLLVTASVVNYNEQ